MVKMQTFKFQVGHSQTYYYPKKNHIRLLDWVELCLRTDRQPNEQQSADFIFKMQFSTSVFVSFRKWERNIWITKLLKKSAAKSNEIQFEGLHHPVESGRVCPSTTKHNITEKNVTNSICRVTLNK